jgi:hypothetical protein
METPDPSPIRAFKASMRRSNYGTFSLSGIDAGALCTYGCPGESFDVSGFDFSSANLDFDLDGQTERAIVLRGIRHLMAADKSVNTTSVSVY